MNTKEELLKHLYSKPRGDIKPGLERTLQLAWYLGNPHTKFFSIHIAGTNGKGATAAITASIVREMGHKVGLYTSPHILNFNERIRVNGEAISDDHLIDIYTGFIEYADSIGATFFEITTVLAFEYFARQEVDIVIVETGMGGRWDSTNIITPLVTAITYVGLDHQEYLGDRIELIALEKAGIIKEGVPIVTYAEPPASDIIEMKAEEKSAPYTNILGAQTLQVTSASKREVRYTDREIGLSDLYFPLPYSAGLLNFSLALSILRAVPCGANFSEDHIRQGLVNMTKNSGYIGRMTPYVMTNQGKEVSVYLDTAHNPDAFEMQAEELSRVYGKDAQAIYILGIMADKDIIGCLEVIESKVGRLLLYRPQTERAAALQYLEKLVSDNGGLEDKYMVIDNDDPGYVLETALEIAAEEGLPIIITGSFYTVEVFLPLISG